MLIGANCKFTASSMSNNAFDFDLWRKNKRKTNLSVMSVFRTSVKQTDSMAKPSRSDINGVYSHFSLPCDHWACPCTSESWLLKLLQHLLALSFLCFVSPAWVFAISQSSCLKVEAHQALQHSLTNCEKMELLARQFSTVDCLLNL